MGCLRSLGCLFLLLLVAVVGYLTRDRWLPLLGYEKKVEGDSAAAVVWEPLTPEGAARARTAVARLGERSGPVFANVRPGDLSAYIFEELSKQLPPSAERTEAAIIGDKLFVRASVKLSDLGGSRALGPFAGMLGDREQVQFGGRLEVIRPGLAQFRVQNIQVRDFRVPQALISRLISNVRRGSRPEGVSEDALPFMAPRFIGDVRIQGNRVTLYKVQRS
ncbi:MAG TPA: hypothetical protein VJ812_02085 [Gemmatimonadaceae bacterium]|nr:hypothetical protein [Gemmatimonadaceae bacterium]